MDNEFDHHTEAEYVVKRDGITPVFVSYTGTNNALLTFSMVNGADSGDQASDTRIANARRLELQSERVVAVPKNGVMV